MINKDTVISTQPAANFRDLRNGLASDRHRPLYHFLAPANWMTLTNFVLKASPSVILDPDNPTSGQRFYRAVELPESP